MGFQPRGELYLLDLALKSLLHEGEHILVLLGGLLGLLLLLVGFKVKVAVGNGLEGMILVLHHYLDSELVHVLSQVENFIALVLYPLQLGQHLDAVNAFAAGVEDLLLAFLHALHVLSESDVLAVE